MADEDIRLPQVPPITAEDPEDVAWALSTAEAMWARGEHTEGIKWIRKAAESAADAEADERALQLAKAASELAGIVARRAPGSSPSLHSPPTKGVPPAPTSSTSSVSKSPSVARGPSPQKAPQKPAFPSPSRVGPAGSVGSSLASTPRPPSIAQRPLGPKSAVAHASAPVPEAAPSSSPSTRQVRPSVPRYDSEATMVGQVQSYVDTSSRLRSIDDDDDDDWAPGGETTMHSSYVDRPTTHEPRAVSMRPPMASAPRHDPEITTSQAVRVVVWRDANGVHVAPAGTVVSAITVDAVLVALEPNADLTAWLSIRQR